MRLKAVDLLAVAAVACMHCACTDEGDQQSSVDAMKQQVAMNDLQILGTETEIYAVDHSRYPRGQGIVALTGVLDIAQPPMIDPWGTPYWYESDGNIYTLRSYGKDAKPDSPKLLRGYWRRETRTPSEDIVFSNGSFVQCPPDIGAEDGAYLGHPCADEKSP